MRKKMITLKRDDFKLIGHVAKHCNWEKLNIAVQEAVLFDLKPLICDMFFEVEAEWEEEEQDEKWDELINGSKFTSCNNSTREHLGLKNLLAYYSYSRYLIINSSDDTPNGLVEKTNQFSIPKPLKEIYAYSNRYRNMAKEIWKNIEMFICLNKDDYPNADLCNCKSCGCNGCCGTKTNTRGFGIKGQNVSKYDL